LQDPLDDEQLRTDADRLRDDAPRQAWANWEKPYAQMAEEDSLPWPTLAALMEAARAFLDPVLGVGARDRWRPSRWSWE
jgi:hypothetical protein